MFLPSEIKTSKSKSRSHKLSETVFAHEVYISDELNSTCSFEADTAVLQFTHCTDYYAPPLVGGGIKRCFCLTSSVCLSVAYIGPKSRTERPRKTKIGTEVAHITMTRIQLSRSKNQRSRSPGRFGWLYWQANMDIQ